jgi:hypothetical protein
MFKKIIFLLLGILFGVVLGLTIEEAQSFGFKNLQTPSKSVIETIQQEQQNDIRKPLNPGSKNYVQSTIHSYEPYQLTLKKLGSPSWNVDIQGSCENAKLSWTQCKLLMGIAGAESGHGTQYIQTSKKGRRKNYDGGVERHNPVGLTRPSSLPYQPIPDCDAEGWCWWQYKFQSWDAFWKFYTQHMANTYLKNGNDQPEKIVRRYVGKFSQNWVNTVRKTMVDFGSVP